jgi:predicted nuclease of predicted toxin-antitoxin system
VDIIKEAESLGGFILTEDKDFGDELVFRKISTNGAMLLRLAGVDINVKIRLVLTAIEKHSEELIKAFSVLNKNKLRIRNLGKLSVY